LSELQAKNVEELRPSKFIQVVIIYKVGGLDVYLPKTQTLQPLQPSTLSSYLALSVKFQNGVPLLPLSISHIHHCDFVEH
jgi:hypothetical protein